LACFDDDAGEVREWDGILYTVIKHQ